MEQVFRPQEVRGGDDLRTLYEDLSADRALLAAVDQSHRVPALRLGCDTGSPKPHPSSFSFSFASTEKSSSVVVSPFTSPPPASSFSRRRMIFPLRVLGSDSVKRI